MLTFGTALSLSSFSLRQISDMQRAGYHRGRRLQAMPPSGETNVGTLRRDIRPITDFVALA